MPIREESFRIGCGRYLQEPNALARCGAEVLRLGKAPLIVGGPTALSLTREKIEKSVKDAKLKYEIIVHAGTCNEEDAKTLAEKALKEGFDVILGVGGGVLMDFAKLIGDEAHLPVINIPTSSATCAAYTPLSVRYTKEGRTVGSRHYGYEVSAVLCDTEIIAKQPVRLFLSGVFDALAKFVEIKQRFNDDVTEYPIGLDWAYTLSKKSFSELNAKTEACIKDMEKGDVTAVIEQMAFATIGVTGVISGIARGSNQCALAHKFYEATRALYFEESREYLHGEIVGVGLLLQNFFNGEVENNEFLLSLMNKYNMPNSLTALGVAATRETQDAYFEKLKNGSAIDETNEDELIRLRAGLEYLWGIK